MGIVVVDYDMGNLRSVYNALVSMGGDVRISSSGRDVENADKLVVPGVGAFHDTMEALEAKALIGPIRDFIGSGRPYLGICLGLQILFEDSEEGEAKGMAVFKGRVKRFSLEKKFKI
ncbi:MAG: imidazole glycerol phosphate synthase subunit HisH, partial [Candidatus Omnitrophota bacterium]